MKRLCFFFSSRRRHTRYWRDWSSDVCSSNLARRVEHVALEPLVAAGEHLLGDLVLVVVVVGPQLPEQPVGPTAGLAAEQVGQFEPLPPVLGPLAGSRVGVDARARAGVELEIGRASGRERG